MDKQIKSSKEKLETYYFHAEGIKIDASSRKEAIKKLAKILKDK